MPTRKPEPLSPCPCGKGAPYPDCCGRWHGGTPAPDAEALMRSRYSAYVLGLPDYLLATWHPTTRPASLELDAPPVAKWLRLAVLQHALSDSDHAVVEFVAHYKVNGRALKMHETSRFVCEAGRWYYVDGEVDDKVADKVDGMVNDKAG